MVSQLFSPSQPKNLSDVFVVLVLGLHILGVYLMPRHLQVPLTAIVFLFWRGCYNVGIGYLLHLQSIDRKLVSWAKRNRIFVNPKTGDNPHPRVYDFIKREMETKIPDDYKFESVPIEYNTWLVFRRIVDLILMCDFVSYCLFAIVCGGRPAGEGYFITAMRWIIGCVLFLFNLWVKLDAHRVVKDYAWYWGDFFYLIDQKLTFDGVFEMAPHPMYSIGYVGYYGISLMAASYRVLFISILAHAAQFAFLFWVENPHIEKTYNAPQPRKRPVEAPSQESLLGDRTHDYCQINSAPPLSSTSPVHNLIGFRNLDLHRTADTSIIFLLFYMFSLAVLTPSSPPYQAFFVINAFLWRLWYSVGVGYVLNRQSTKQRWTRHFLKYGESSEEAWRQWKSTYHTAMTMCYASFIAASWKMYSFPADWDHGLAILKHVIGAGLISLQVWTSVSIYASLGEFGWFFGDFFFDCQPKLTYSGIYRFLNNPERVLGLAGTWGATLITGSTTIFCLALLSHFLALSFIQLVERPHMQKLYGESLRRESGLTKSLKRSLPPHIVQLQGNVYRIMEETIDSIEDFFDAARPKLAAGVSHVFKDTTAFFKQPTRIMVKRLDPSIAGFDPQDYSLKIEGTPINSPGSWNQGKETRTRPEARTDFQTIRFEYGAPLKVRWTAPLNHGRLDWIGLYMVADNASREVTRVSSQGRWVATKRDQYSSSVAAKGILISEVRTSGAERKDGSKKDYLSGEIEFSGDKLWWRTGVFEFRYHHNGKHNVMAISLPFEITINKFDEDSTETESDGSFRETVEQVLLQLVQNCFDRDTELAPTRFDETFGSQVNRNDKYARRVVYAVQQM